MLREPEPPATSYLKSMHPILFHIGSLPVRAYGTLIVLGFMVGLWRAMGLCTRRMQAEPEGSPRRISPDDMFDIGFYGLIVGIIGARLLFVALDWGSFAAHPIDALKFWQGGLSLHGGMLGAILFLIYMCRRKRLSLLAAGDIGAVSWAIAYAIGRIGCLLNGCCYGGVCDLPWGVRFPDELHPGALTPPSHPIQLYATLFNLVFFAVLLRWEKRKRADGELYYGYIFMYGFYRYVVEIFRAGVTSTYVIPRLHLTDTHLISLFMMLVGVMGVVWVRRNRPIYADAAMPISSAPLISPTPGAASQ